jgi:lipopolysaccharide/colanic/teichoic acid biosynthesis glycosyltransferase
VAEKKLERRIYFFVKRIMDITLSVMGLLILFPVLLITAAAIRMETKGGILFTQLRTGKNGKTFKMYKFRSMCMDAEKKRKELTDRNEIEGPIFKIAKDPRITKVGKIIRRFSIDELPQLVNVIKGEMSIIGPRPLATYETEEFTEYENLRHKVKPGLTCLWQISGRSDTTFEQMIGLDLKYLRKMSIFTDIRILFKTVGVVVLGKGAY